MSDYASCITQPFLNMIWARELQNVHAYLIELGWTEVNGPKGMTAFAGIVRDVSEAAVTDQIDGIIADIAEMLQGRPNFAIAVAFDGDMAECETFRTIDHEIRLPE